MLNKSFSATLALSVLVTALAAQAHDPKEHAKDKNEKPNCAVMENMDHNKMDMNDPVMQAMMKKCKHHMHDDKESSDTEDGEHSAEDEHPSQEHHD